MIVTDMVYDQIWLEVASHRPERGGALFGPRGYPAVTHFHYDAHAETTAASYIPSEQLINGVKRIEEDSGLQFKGIIHSHPSGYVRPSPADEAAAENFFRRNPHFSTISLPIVQTHVSSIEVPRPEFIRWYKVEWRGKKGLNYDFRFGRGLRPDSNIRVADEDMHILPVWEHLSTIINGLALAGFHLIPNRVLVHVNILGSQLIGIVSKSDAGNEFIFLVALDYPVVAPVVLYQKGDATNNLLFLWDGLKNVTESLAEISKRLSLEWGHGDSDSTGVA